MLRKILIPLDRSSLAERVLDHLQWLAPVGSTEIVLVSVIEPWHYLYNSADYSPPDMVNYIHKHVKGYLEGQQAQLQQKGYAVSLQAIEGDPAQTILEVAEAESVDLIAMSTHGRSGFIRWALGSVAERVIHDAGVPIFLVREHTPLPATQGTGILVPLDGSELAEQALPLAQQVATSIGARILLLRVLDTLDGDGVGLLFESKAAVDEMMAQWRSEAESYLEEVAKKLHLDGNVVETRIVSGQPDRMICDVASYEGIDLIVMSTHGRSGLSRWVYGSTANKVLRIANCPLLLVRAALSGGELAQKAGEQSSAPLKR